MLIEQGLALAMVVVAVSFGAAALWIKANTRIPEIEFDYPPTEEELDEMVDYVQPREIGE